MIARLVAGQPPSVVCYDVVYRLFVKLNEWKIEKSSAEDIGNWQQCSIWESRGIVRWPYISTKAIGKPRCCGCVVSHVTGNHQIAIDGEIGRDGQYLKGLQGPMDELGVVRQMEMIILFMCGSVGWQTRETKCMFQ